MSPNQSLGILMDDPHLEHVKVQLWCFSILCRILVISRLVDQQKIVFYQGKMINIHWLQILKQEDFLLLLLILL